MLTDSTQKYFRRVEGLYDQKQYMSFANVLAMPDSWAQDYNHSLKLGKP